MDLYLYKMPPGAETDCAGRQFVANRLRPGDLGTIKKPPCGDGAFEARGLSLEIHARFYFATAGLVRLVPVER